MTTNKNEMTKAEVNAEQTALAVKEEFPPIVYSAKSAALADSINRYNAIAANIGLAVGNAKAAIADGKAKAATIFYGWKNGKIYETEGFKTLPEMLDALGLKKSEVNKAIRYATANHDHGDAFKNMTVDNYACINSALGADAARVVSDAKAGILDGMTQNQLKDYAARVIRETPSAKSGKVVSLYYGRIANGKEYDEPRPLNEWLTYHSEDDYSVKSVNDIKVEGVDKVLVIIPLDLSQPPFLLFLAKKTEQKTETSLRAQLIARLSDINANGKTGVNSGLLALGFEPLTDAECEQYNLI